MTAPRRLASSVASGVVGALVGALVVLGADGLTRTPGRGPDSQLRPVDVGGPTSARFRVGADRVLLAWSPTATGGLPARAQRLVEAMPAVASATTVLAGLDWLRSSHAPDGTTVDASPRGLAIPVEIAVVRPASYAAFVPAAERDLVAGLTPGKILLARSEARLRGGGEGLDLELKDRQLEVAGVVSDVATNGYEGLVAGPVPGSWRRADRYLLIRLRRAGDRAEVARRLRSMLGPGSVLRVRSQRETPFLRYGDAVQPQMIIKKHFGEFAARPHRDGTITVDRRWVDRNIRRAHVPILGTVACHRSFLPQLREALRTIASDGLAYLVDRRQYGGCYNPRFISRQPGGRLSHHAWGIALDINWRDNGFGTKPDMDRRVVERMEAWGLTWGGRWLIPDGMHFEWTAWPLR